MKRLRILKKAAAGLLVMAMTVAVAVPTGVRADHKRPDGGICDNTVRTYNHLNYVTSQVQGSHLATGGYTCIITGLVYYHTIVCSSCKTQVGASSYACTTVHSKCGTQIVNHPAY